MMFPKNIHFPVLLQIVCNFVVVDTVQVEIDSDKVSFALVGFRHGARNPTEFLFGNDSRQNGQWGIEGAGQLTELGKRQGFKLGKFLRHRYLSLVNVVSDFFVPNQIRAITSSSDRCQMFLQCVLAGFYPARKQNTQNRTQLLDDWDWQPIPYAINDDMLRVHDSSCPTYLKVYNPFSIDNVPAVAVFKQGKEALIDFISQNTGLAGNLLKMSNVADNVLAMLHNNVTLPEWLSEPKVEDIVAFQAARAKLCSVNETCARPLAGVWLDEIYKQLIDKVSGKMADRKINLYATHIEAVMPLLRFMGANVSNVPFGAGFALEVRENPNPETPASLDNARIRMILFDPVSTSFTEYQAKPIKLLLAQQASQANDGFWYGMPDFLARIDSYRIDNFRKYCAEKCDW